MNTKETTDLAKLLTKLPGIRSIDIKDVRHLVELLRESPEIGSIEVKGWFGTGVLITRTGNHAVQVSGPMAMPMAAAPVAAPVASPAPAAPAAAALKEIKSPMVGTFYRAPEPGAEPYVKVGSRVSAGQTVCIIEAMKIMNEIEAEVTGVVKEVCLEDASPVEFGTVLYRVDPNG
ncbi:MAG TPA: acetyl-CoA carboxylase biotin carboxyl carrier protein [Gemmatimonadales bacterium]|jgi:acetyl-CoA carboxylase biotin carboxyl carrier protein|nr:acetyl-CoA carboxylase biotin carboxyl carrier protein [Gemmatimonadales bacterium]